MPVHDLTHPRPDARRRWRWPIAAGALAALGLAVAVLRPDGGGTAGSALGPTTVAERRDLVTSLTADGTLRRSAETVVTHGGSPASGGDGDGGPGGGPGGTGSPSPLRSPRPDHAAAVAALVLAAHHGTGDDVVHQHHHAGLRRRRERLDHHRPVEHHDHDDARLPVDHVDHVDHLDHLDHRPAHHRAARTRAPVRPAPARAPGPVRPARRRGGAG
jgi:hypothetical protein